MVGSIVGIVVVLYLVGHPETRTGMDTKATAPGAGVASATLDEFKLAGTEATSAADSSRSYATPESGKDAGPPDASVPFIRLFGDFWLPNFTPVQVSNGELTFRSESGYSKSVHVQSAGAYIAEGLPPSDYTVSGVMDEYRLDPVTVALLATTPSQQFDLTLWPTGVMRLKVQVSDGRSYQALAEDVGLPPREVFSNGFSVCWASPQGCITPLDGSEPVLEQVAYPLRRGLPDNCVGHVSLQGRLPAWIGLRFHEVFIGSTYAESTGHDLTFTVEPDFLAHMLASLHLFVVNEDGGGPLVDASVRLTAEHSELRRATLFDVHPSRDGEVTFDRLIPGNYDIMLRRGEDVTQKRFQLAAGQALDLGRMSLGPGHSVNVLVVMGDAREPCPGVVRFGPYREGVLPEKIFAQSSVGTKGDGRARVPAPSVLSVMRANLLDADQLRSCNVLLDPGSLPSGVVVLELQKTMGVVVEVPTSAAHLRFRICDTAGVTVYDVPQVTALTHSVKVIPGEYKAYLIGPNDEQVLTRTFTINKNTTKVAL
jgi:hypothetical protein